MTVATVVINWEKMKYCIKERLRGALKANGQIKRRF